MSSGLQAELKQHKPFRSVIEEAFVSLARTAAVLEHSLAQALKPYDITSTQYNVLRILRGAGAEGLCRNEVGERLVRTVPDVTRLLDRMEDTGLITRTRSGSDRRYVTTMLTPRGLALVNDLDDEIVAIHERQLGHVNSRDLKKLVAILEEVRRNP
jgi:DNA-binding MarR family transcriptional regulator